MQFLAEQFCSHSILYNIDIQGSYCLGQLMLIDKLPETKGKMVISFFVCDDLILVTE